MEESFIHPLGRGEPDLQIFALHVRLNELDRFFCMCAAVALMCRSCGENRNFVVVVLFGDLCLFFVCFGSCCSFLFVQVETFFLPLRKK